MDSTLNFRLKVAKRLLEEIRKAQEEKRDATQEIPILKKLVQNLKKAKEEKDKGVANEKVEEAVTPKTNSELYEVKLKRILFCYHQVFFYRLFL